jgi:hypothetical protein
MCLLLAPVFQSFFFCCSSTNETNKAGYMPLISLYYLDVYEFIFRRMDNKKSFFNVLPGVSFRLIPEGNFYSGKMVFAEGVSLLMPSKLKLKKGSYLGLVPAKLFLWL